jgi:hypothetical protein
MKFAIERMEVTDSLGALAWSGPASPQKFCDADGVDATSVLSGVVVADGATQVNVAVSFLDGQAITIARKGGALYALRAVPAASDLVVADRPAGT